MLWPATLIGAGAGFAIASIPGAMLGALLGQVLDRHLHLQSWAHLREKLGGDRSCATTNCCLCCWVDWPSVTEG